MYFKKLELQGFKSFVDQSSLDLEKGITAVIGPNGCGKSNVVDSIRWVLGETSAKALRGSKMEDVIFNGTDQRKAVGMAEVSLTIDNQDHQLPTEHDEVTITRRTFRSGDSEYLINKTTCRLRDIQELFLDTGIGRNAYSILEQGKIDLIVSSKPSDRRFVFEEAAGISKYKSRKEESLRKLDSTEQNFLRINDIAAEVKRQINSLERQVQKARRYQSFKQELTTLEVAQGRKELNQRRLALRQNEQQWEEYKNTLNDSERQQSGYETELEGLIADLSSVETELGEMQSMVHQLQQEMIKAEDFIASSELRKQDLIINLKRLQQEKESLLEKENQLKTKSSSAVELSQSKKVELEQLQDNLNQEEEQLNRLESELKAKAAKIQDRQHQLLQLVDQMSSLRGSLKSLEIRRSEKEQQQSKLINRLNTLKEQNQEAFDEKHQYENELSSLKESYEKLKETGNQLTQQREQLNQTLLTLSAMLESYNKTQTKLTSRLAWIEELKNGLAGYESGAKSILLENQSNPERFEGLIGPLVNFIRTEQTYELAMEALLGHQLQYILVEKSDVAKAAVRFLEEDNRGRATFIPLEQARAKTSTNQENATAAWFQQSGVFGWAKKLVKIDERFRAIFDVLLDDVVLVDNRETAAVCRQQGATCTLVTLTGEIENNQGWLTGGSKDMAEYGLLGREREIEELNQELEVLQKNLDQAYLEEETTKNQLEEINGYLRANQEEIHENEIKCAQVEKSLENISSQLQDVEQQMEQVELEKEENQKGLEATLQEHRQIAGQLSGLELTDKETQEELSANQIEIEESRKEYDERSLYAGELRVMAASIEEQLSNLQSDANRMTEELKELAKQIEEKQNDLLRDETKLNELDGLVNHTQGKLVELNEQKVMQDQSLEALKFRRQELNERRQEYEKNVRNVRQSLDSLNRTLHQLELQKTQLKINLESLENYLVEEYKLNLSMVEEEAEHKLEEQDPATIQERIKELKQKIASMGSVNLVAMEEYDELQDRYEFLSKQLEDLKEAKETLQRLISKINHESKARFTETFGMVRKEFKEVFRRLFNGGDADLILVDESNVLETGIEIIARPPGKRLQNISLLSGGEKALTAIALLFSIFLIKPSPFCIFDEMDAPLDDINTARFCRILQEFAEKSQFIVITHNKVTMETAQVLYGVTMQESGVSQLISVKFKGDEIAPVNEQTTLITQKALMN